MITYGNTVDINSVSGFRPWRQFTLTNTKLLESLHSEYPAHDMNINGWGFTLEHSHLESTKLEAITIGKDAPTSNIGLDDLWINSNIGWTQNGAASTGISAGATGNNHSCAIRIFSRYGEPTGIRISHIDEQGAAPAIGSNQPANVLCDDGNNNIITVAACPHLGYYNLDGSGSATTDCPANSIQNGMAFNDGTITVRSGGATVMQISATGAALVSAALTGTPTAPTQASSDNSTSLATDAFVKNQAYATLASPTFTGTPVVPGYAKTGTLVSGNYASATGTGTVGDSTIVAGPYNSVWSLPGSVSTTTPVACSGSANKVTVWGLALSYPLKTSNIAYYVQGTDNTANTYDIGIYSTSGAQIVHTGSLAGTSFAPSTGYKAQAWTAANTVIQPGNYYIALTCSATSGTATFGYTFTWASAANTVESLSSGSGGTLPATQTVPSAIAMTNASTIQFAVY